MWYRRQGGGLPSEDVGLVSTAYWQGDPFAGGYCISFYGVTLHIIFLKVEFLGSSLAVRWLGLRTSTAGGTGLIPGRGARILHAVQCGKKKEN